MLTTEKKPKNDPKLGRFEKPRFQDFLQCRDFSKNPGTGDFLQNPFFARLQKGVFFTFLPVPRLSPVPENPGTGKSEKPVFARLQKISYRNSKILVLGYRRKNFKTRFLPVSCSVEKYVILLL